MKNSLILFIILTLPLLSKGQDISKQLFINPTGSYKLDNKTYVKDGETYGAFGTIKVKLLRNSKIAVSFFYCKGAIAYTSGSFLDTLIYKNNRAIYLTPAFDSTCKITFIFKKAGLTVSQEQADLNNGCGFGHGVIADGYFKKTSSQVPIIKDPNLDN